jgi:Rieske Fe-S protein
MARCEKCGNDYDKSFDLILAGRTHTFDSFECAIATVAPTCSHCGCRIMGHGMEVQGRFFCCAHCAAQSGNPSLRDRVD